MNVIERFGEIKTNEKVSASINFVLAVLFLVLTGFLVMSRNKVETVIISRIKNHYYKIILSFILVAVLNAVSGSMNFI